MAIRAARAARELGIGSAAVFSHEDRSALHRQAADEAYQVGEAGHPVRSYLDTDALLGIPRASGADAVYSGYGFLSESAVFAQAVVDAGLTRVGPSPETLGRRASERLLQAAPFEAHGRLTIQPRSELDRPGPSREAI